MDEEKENSEFQFEFQLLQWNATGYLRKKTTF